MEDFVTKWDKITNVSGEKLFKPQTILAIEKLKHHILAGCLSDIPPGGGTNRNERLHEHINKYILQQKQNWHSSCLFINAHDTLCS